MKELVNCILVEKSGISLCAKYMNDRNASYRVRRDDTLSNAFEAEGNRGLHREVIRMLYEERIEFRGKHKSLACYRYAMNAPESKEIYQRYCDLIQERYETLSEGDKRSIWSDKLTEKAREYKEFSLEMSNKMYADISKKCFEYYTYGSGV